MKSFLRRVCGMLIGIAVAPTAHADWQYAAWGMQPSVVVEASGGQARLMSKPGERSCVFKGTTCLAFAPVVSIPPYQFEVRFGFADDDTLNSVLLVTTPDHFYELDRALRGSYGEPVSAQNGFLANRIWRDAAAGNLVRLMNMDDQVIIQYTPIIKGL